ncbi:DNA polymerase zeta catalytic subunit-like [Phalaenopsis equestris]|uniref:DNA polymerase zeta catalytic subunit-like n=1 Tax=Phalaenopsis equestris TaxID=78828 RepID=UPI0009E4565F|nr:DNA polymerase zeta catalytic subunit-like [Phalaenopsis equestris]
MFDHSGGRVTVTGEGDSGMENIVSLDTEALGLLSWLASSQAEEETDTGDELLHEAILSPLFPGKSFSMALELAHRDYEHASQLECQDILDSVEDILMSEKPKEQEFLDAVSCGSFIPQVDGSFDDNWNTPQKGNTSGENTSRGEEKAVAQIGGMCQRVGNKSKEKNIWGNLPFSVSKNEHEASKTCYVASSPCNEMINDGFNNPPFYDKEGNQYEGFKDKIVLEKCEKGGKTTAMCSIRDLMRKKRFLRVEQAEPEIRMNEGMVHGQKEELSPTTSVREGLHFDFEEPSIGQSATHQNVQGRLACSNIASSDVQGTECFEHQSSICHTHTARKAAPPGTMKCRSNHEEDSAGNASLKSRKNENWNSENIANKHASNPESVSAQDALLLDKANNCYQQSTPHDENNRDFCKAKNFLEVVDMTFINKPPSNNHTHGSEGSLPAGQASGKIDKRQGMENMIPFFTRIPPVVNLQDENVIFSRDSSLGIPTHFQNDGSVLYLLTHALSPPALKTVYNWLSRGKQHCFLEATGATNEGLSSYCDGVLNEGTSCQTSPSPSAIGWSQNDSSQSNKEKSSPKTEKFDSNIGHVSSEPIWDNILAKEKIINEDMHDFSQISGPEKYENSNTTPVSQIGFRDPASFGGGQQLTLISMEIQAESRGNLRPDPKFDAINVLSLVVQEDTNNDCQVYVLLRVLDDKLGERRPIQILVLSLSLQLGIVLVDIF